MPFEIVALLHHPLLLAIARALTPLSTSAGHPINLMGSEPGLEFPECCYSTSGSYVSDPIRGAAPIHDPISPPVFVDSESPNLTSASAMSPNGGHATVNLRFSGLSTYSCRGLKVKARNAQPESVQGSRFERWDEGRGERGGKALVT